MNQHQRLNADVGEGFDDALIMPYLDCANVACAAHAGDEQTVRETLKLAKQHRVTVGAHPGYPDKANFGRHSINLTEDDLIATLTAQIHWLIDLADKQDLTLTYVKPHGALNHDMVQKNEILDSICRAVARTENTLALVIPTNANQCQQQHTAAQYGLAIWWEVYADRAYEANGLLRPRQFSDAVHTDPQTIIEQLQHIRERGEIVAIDGTVLDIRHAQTICIHGDHSPSVTAVQTAAQTWAKPI